MVTQNKEMSQFLRYVRLFTMCASWLWHQLKEAEWEVSHREGNKHPLALIMRDACLSCRKVAGKTNVQAMLN